MENVQQYLVNRIAQLELDKGQLVVALEKVLKENAQLKKEKEDTQNGDIAELRKRDLNG